MTWVSDQATLAPSLVEVKFRQRYLSVSFIISTSKFVSRKPVKVPSTYMSESSEVATSLPANDTGLNVVDQKVKASNFHLSLAFFPFRDANLTYTPCSRSTVCSTFTVPVLLNSHHGPDSLSILQTESPTRYFRHLKLIESVIRISNV